MTNLKNTINVKVSAKDKVIIRGGIPFEVREPQMSNEILEELDYIETHLEEYKKNNKCENLKRNLCNMVKYKGCRDCYIEPAWLLIYKYLENELVLLLVNAGSHGNVF